MCHRLRREAMVDRLPLATRLDQPQSPQLRQAGVLARQKGMLNSAFADLIVVVAIYMAAQTVTAFI